MERNSATAAALLALLCWTVGSAAAYRWHENHELYSPYNNPHTRQWQSSPRSGNTIETLQPREGRPGSIPALSTLLRGLLQRRHQHGRPRHGGSWAATGGTRGSGTTITDRREPWTSTSDRRGPRTTINDRREPWTSTSDRRGPRTTINDRRGSGTATNGGRHSLYAMAGGRWPGRSDLPWSAAGGRSGLPWSVAGRGWAQAGQGWPLARTPGHGRGHIGWGIVATIGGRGHTGGGGHCKHGRRGWSWPALPTEPEPTEQPAEQPTEAEYEDPDEYEGSGLDPDEPTDPAEPSDPTEPTDPAVATEAAPTPPEKQDCAEGAVFRDGECVCRDPRQFLDTILERCVDTRVVIY